MNQSLNKVIAERRRRRKEKAEEKRVERRERLIREQGKLISLKEASQKLIEDERIRALKQAEEAAMTKPHLEDEQTEQLAAKPMIVLEPKKQAKQVLSQTEIIQIDNLPVNFSRLMLDELIKNYPGCQKVMQMDGAACRAVIEFDSPDNAKFAVMGLNRFIVDQNNRMLSVSFVQK